MLIKNSLVPEQLNYRGGHLCQQFLGWTLLALLPLQSLLCPLPISLVGLHFHHEFRKQLRNEQIGACVQHCTRAYFCFLLARFSVALLILFSWELHPEKEGHAKKKWFLTWLRDSLLLIRVCHWSKPWAACFWTLMCCKYRDLGICESK